MNIALISEQVQGALAGRNDLVAVYLYGSVAGGVAHKWSDVDVAVLLAGELTDAQMFEHGLEIGALLETALRPMGVAVDLVVLNRATPAVAFQVLKTGQLLMDCDPKARGLFVMRALSRYYDSKRYRDYHLERFLTRVRKEGLGHGYHGHRNALAEARRLSARLAANAGRVAG